MSYIVKPPCDEAVIQSAPISSTNEVARTISTTLSMPAKSTGRWVLVATILGSSMAFIDGTVVNVALPVLQTELHATATDVQWVVEAYSLFLAALILVGGSLGDHFGRRRVFAIGIVLFTGASVLCGLAPNVNFLIFARAFQGVGGALLVPGSLAIISASFDRKQRGTAIGTWSGFTAITSAIGALKGPLHGGANESVFHILMAIDRDGADPVEYIKGMLAQKRKVPGFGHRVYHTEDPRATHLRKMSEDLGHSSGETKWFEFSNKIEGFIKADKKLNANVDFYSASTYHTLGIEVDLFTPVFAVSRISGWSAHVIEQLDDNRLIRPRADYIGPIYPSKYVPMEKR